LSDKKWNFLEIFEKHSNVKIHENPSSWSRVFHADRERERERQRDRERDGQTWRR